MFIPSSFDFNSGEGAGAIVEQCANFVEGFDFWEAAWRANVDRFNARWRMWCHRRQKRGEAMIHAGGVTILKKLFSIGFGFRWRLSERLLMGASPPCITTVSRQLFQRLERHVVVLFRVYAIDNDDSIYVWKCYYVWEAAICTGFNCTSVRYMVLLEVFDLAKGLRFAYRHHSD